MIRGSALWSEEPTPGFMIREVKSQEPSTSPKESESPGEIAEREKMGVGTCLHSASSLTRMHLSGPESKRVLRESSGQRKSPKSCFGHADFKPQEN